MAKVRVLSIVLGLQHFFSDISICLLLHCYQQWAVGTCGFKIAFFHYFEKFLDQSVHAKYITGIIIKIK